MGLNLEGKTAIQCSENEDFREKSKKSKNRKKSKKSKNPKNLENPTILRSIGRLADEGTHRDRSSAKTFFSTSTSPHSVKSRAPLPKGDR